MFKQDLIQTYHQKYLSACLKNFYLGYIKPFLIKYRQLGVQFLREHFAENSYDKNTLSWTAKEYLNTMKISEHITIQIIIVITNILLKYCGN